MINWAKRVGLENGIVVVIKKSATLKGGKLPKCHLMCERGGKYQPPRHLVEGVLQYICETWLHPYKERFVSAWVDTCMHLGSNSSQRYSHFIDVVCFNYVGCCTILILLIVKTQCIFCIQGRVCTCKTEVIFGRYDVIPTNIF